MIHKVIKVMIVFKDNHDLDLILSLLFQQNKEADNDV